MSRFYYNYRVQANFHFDWKRVKSFSAGSQLKRFTELVWAGRDGEGWCVYKRDPYSNDVIRIDFLPPPY